MTRPTQDRNLLWQCQVPCQAVWDQPPQLLHPRPKNLLSGALVDQAAAEHEEGAAALPLPVRPPPFIQVPGEAYGKRMLIPVPAMELLLGEGMVELNQSELGLHYAWADVLPVNLQQQALLQALCLKVIRRRL